ncbi:ABC-2 type transport system ATP-binding protein [Pullulanibacillus pueri]|uniref:ABC transporter ATP-binding protein n=1 Tax=Pullulanibacillus pueri TaxID=1437324 RepID=A0A8J2ZXU0_9BACL|nr:ABC transporter ATP-binding protein [Pullulanibacillus pueri]MBM7681725.1 ABC-2 type transport system ATP-binding protein [Pullulanibacillus pueri]GGH84060.1 ABC transporter ATP-binding protein [Pullulanibacillus pueri]
MSKVVDIHNLTKSYGKDIAVKDVSFSIESNKICGLLGRNGAGKTTIMHMITAQLFPTSGDLKIFDERPYENRDVLNKICFIKESQKYPPNFCVHDVLEVAATLFPNWDQRFAKRLLKDFNLPRKRRIKKLSRGMLSSVGIIIGLASRAPLTIFDEPYLGLDAVARNLFYNHLIEDYADHPRTILLSTHLIDEVSKILEQVMVIDKGELIINEEADSLRGSAYAVAGLATKVDAFIQGKKVINKPHSLGGFTSAVIMDTPKFEDRKQADLLGLNITSVSIQELIVHLTGGNSQGKAVELQ